MKNSFRGYKVLLGMLLLIFISQSLQAQSQDAAVNTQNDVEALMQLADSLDERDHFDKAIPVYERILELNPNTFEVYEDLTKTYASLGMFQQAERRAWELYIDKPENPASDRPFTSATSLTFKGYYHCRLALFKTMQGKLEAAIAHVDSMVILEGPDKGNTCAQYFLTRAGEFDRAGTHLDRLLNATSGLERAIFLPQAAYVARKRGDVKKEAEFLSEIETIQNSLNTGQIDVPKEATYRWRAEVLTLQGEKEAAIDLLWKLYKRGYRNYYGIIAHGAIFQELKGHPKLEQLMKEMKKDIDRMRENVIKEQGS